MMAEHFSMLLVAWVFLLVIGGWVLVNALIDLGARHVRRWLSGHWNSATAVIQGVPPERVTDVIPSTE